MDLRSGHILNLLLKEKGITVESLARICGLGFHTVRGLVIGSRTSCRLAITLKIAGALDAPVEELFAPQE